MKVNEKCTGCMACYNACPVRAIEIIQNDKGFYEPNIIEEKCIKCKKCKVICPEINHREKNTVPSVYAAWNKEKNTRKNSTSGGVFSIIATEVLNLNGIVFGAMFDEEFRVIHSYITKTEDLFELRGSKYVQSFIGNSFQKAKQFLEEGRVVLFSGTACQISGLLNYLQKDYINLITIDILCHGVPSPKIFKEYIKNINREQNKIKEIRFRYKKPSWTVFSMKIDYEDGRTYMKSTFKDPYLRGFLEDYTTNEICAECQYTGEKRISDITLADFWGYISDEFKTRNTEQGISLILVNTEKGKNLLNKLNKKMVIINKTIQEAMKGNKCLNEPFKKNNLYDEFWKEYKENGYENVSAKYFKPRKMKLKRRLSLLFNDYAYIIPYKIRNKLIKVREQNNKRE